MKVFVLLYSRDSYDLTICGVTSDQEIATAWSELSKDEYSFEQWTLGQVTFPSLRSKKARELARHIVERQAKGGE